MDRDTKRLRHEIETVQHFFAATWANTNLDQTTGDQVDARHVNDPIKAGMDCYEEVRSAIGTAIAQPVGELEARFQ